MYSIRKQRGMTAVGWVFVFLMIAVITLIVLKLLPIYLDGFYVDSAVASLKKEHNIGQKSPIDIKRILMKRLDVNMVDGVTKDDIYIERNKGMMTIEVDYEVREKLAGNLDVVVSFNSIVEVPAR
jgi:hypothetical protein